MLATVLWIILSINLDKVKNVYVVTKAAHTVTIAWNDVSRAKSYHVRVFERNQGDWVQTRVLTGIKQTSKRVKKLEPDTRYRFQVRAVRKANRGKWSKAITARTLVETVPEEDTDCVSDTTPSFTVDITDLDQVSSIVQPPSLAGDVLKTHAFIHTDLARVPVYAPVAGYLVDGAFYLEGNEGGEYLLDFDVSCEITWRYDHITEPIDTIVAALPAEPADTTETIMLTEPIHFEVGDLIGYTTGTIYGVWDLGVYNSAIENQFSDDPEYQDYDTVTTAVCPFDFFAGDQREAYYALFAKTAEQTPTDSTEFCVE